MNLGQLSLEVLAVFGGIQVVVAGLVTFVSNAWLSSKLEREKADLEKTLHVKKTQFETELAIYRELWKELCQVRAAGWEVKRYSPDSFSLEMKIGDAFSNSVHGLRLLIEVHRPFITAEIARLLFELLKQFDALSDDSHNSEEHAKGRPLAGRTPADQRPDWLANFPTAAEVRKRYYSLVARTDDIHQKTSEICEAIRARLSGEAVLLEKEQYE